MRKPLLVFLGAVIVFMMFSPGAIAQNCYESSIVSPSPFMGNNGELFRLADGSLWEVKYEYEYLYEYYPSVVICPSQGKLIVGQTSLTVELVAAGPGFSGAGSKQSNEWEIVEETHLKGSISGTVKKGRIFRTTSGSIYEVTGLTLQLVLELQPEVIVLRSGDNYKLIVEGFDEPLVCKCLNCSRFDTHVSLDTSQEQKATIKAFQWALSTLGFDPGSADGTLGPKARSAMKTFRVSNGLATTGNLDAVTLRFIAIALTKKHPDKSEALTVAAYLLQASENWSPSPYGMKATVPQAVTSEVIESSIDGEFEGWEGETVFRLMNGQIWQQVEYAYHYHYEYMPDVLIVKTSRGFIMQVDGIDETIQVVRLK